jgi:hypothetical protein
VSHSVCLPFFSLSLFLSPSLSLEREKNRQKVRERVRQEDIGRKENRARERDSHTGCKSKGPFEDKYFNPLFWPRP